MSSLMDHDFSGRLYKYVNEFLHDLSKSLIYQMTCCNDITSISSFQHHDLFHASLTYLFQQMIYNKLHIEMVFHLSVFFHVFLICLNLKTIDCMCCNDKAFLHSENLTKGQWKKPQKLLVCIEKCLL